MFTINEYFDGQVKSIGFNAQDLPATIGVMAPGEYNFDTSKREYVTVISGKLSVKLPSAVAFKDVNEGETFIVEANQNFELQVAIETAYLCKYE